MIVPFATSAESIAVKSAACPPLLAIGLAIPFEEVRVIFVETTFDLDAA